MSNEINDNEIALDWISTIESEKSRIRETDIYPKINAWFKVASPKNILEIGCGQGVCSQAIDSEDCDYVGIDPSEILIKRATELYSSNGSFFKIGDAYHLPFKNDFFDAAFSVSVWHLLDNLKTASHELSRVLKAKGHYLIISANPAAYSLWTSSYFEARQVGKRFEGRLKLQNGTIVEEALFLHSMEEIKDALETSGLKIVNIESFRTSEKSNGQAQFILISGEKSE